MTMEELVDAAVEKGLRVLIFRDDVVKDSEPYTLQILKFPLKPGEFAITVTGKTFQHLQEEAATVPLEDLDRFLGYMPEDDGA